MIVGLLKSAQTMWELGIHELLSQRRETLLGFVWMVVWPFVQAGGFLIMFSIIRGGGFSGEMLVTYMGVLVWSTVTLLLTASFGFLAKNLELIKHLVFPFHLILLNDVNIKFMFFLVQFIAATSIFLSQNQVSSLPLSIFSLALFAVSLYLILISICWAGSVMGAIIPDLGIAIPSVFMLLLGLSPIFHQDINALPRPIVLLNLFNPLSQLVTAFYDCIGRYGEVHPPYTLAVVALAAFVLTRLGTRRLYQEIAKII